MSILTVSREFGSGGERIGRVVAQATGYEYLDRNSMLAEIGEMGVNWQELEKKSMEWLPTIWERYDWSFKACGALIHRAMLDHAVMDGKVILGRGGHLVLKNVPHVLRIRMTAPLEVRMRCVMQRESVDMDTAKWLIEKTDRERAGYDHALYGRDWSDPAEYDFVFDSNLVAIDRIKDFILDLLAEKDHLKSEESQNMLEKLAVAGRIKAALLTDGRFFNPTLDVYVDETDIVLRGVVRDLKEHDLIEKAARNLAAGFPFESHLTVRG